MSFSALPSPDAPSGPGRRRLPAIFLGGSAVVAVVVAAVVYLGGSPVSSAAAPAASPVPSSTFSSVPASVPASAPVSPSASTSVSPSASVSRKPDAPGWTSVDPLAWKAQVAAYNARKVDPVPAGVGDKPEFRADCTYSHRAADDPIVFPGLPGASHMHSFVGNKAVDANTTAGDLTKFTASTCKPAVDHSSYWVPTLYDAATNRPVETTGFRVYYRSIRDNSAGMLPIPTGLRMIAGDARKRTPTPRGAQGQFYCAFYGPGDLDGIARSGNGNWPICGGDATLHFMLQFPDCWDGKHLDSPDHKSHVAYGTNGGCPADHPVRIPALTFDIQYGVKGTTQGYYLSSDPTGKSASSMHGDAFLMWDTDAMNKRTKDCVAQRRTCDNDGYLH